MKVKASELTGAALDWAVAKCEGWEAGKYMMSPEIRKDAYGDVIGIKVPFDREYMWFKPSTNWAQGGPIIERGLIHTYPRFISGRTEGGSDVYQQDGWAACVTPPAFWVTPRPFTGPTPLIAAMRCYCCAKLGDEVDVPEELL